MLRVKRDRESLTKFTSYKISKECVLYSLLSATIWAITRLFQIGVYRDIVC